MIAYNRNGLDALQTRDFAREWHEKGLLSEEKWQAIQEKNQAPFYTPNVFVRIGLAFFSLILLSAALGLLALITDTDSDSGMAILFLFFGALALALLEFWAIGAARHFASGVDDMLLYFGVGVLLGGIFMQLPYYTDTLVYYIIAWPFLLLGSIRYTDRLLAAATFYCSLAIWLLLVAKIPNLALYLLPFAGMLFGSGVYLLAIWGQRREDGRYWHSLLNVVELLALLVFYASGNYWVVQQAGADLYQVAQPPLGWFFWTFTFVVPVAYIVEGLRRKDRLLLDIGLACIPAAVFSFRYYFHVLPLAWAAVIGGGVLFAGAYYFIQYLRKNEGAYTYEAHGDISLLQEIEQQLIEQTIANQSAPTPVKKESFGGGEFGGGGAGGEF